MAKQLATLETVNPLADEYEYVVRVSRAKMPSKCWGRYSHVGVLRVVRGHSPAAIRESSRAEVVWYRGKLFDGTSDLCARSRTERRARVIARELNEQARQARNDRQTQAYLESLTERTDEI